MPAIHEIGHNALLFQQFIDRNPIDASRLHCHRINATGEQPGNQGIKIGGKGAEDANWFRVTIGWHGNDNLISADIDPSRVGEDRG